MESTRKRLNKINAFIQAAVVLAAAAVFAAYFFTNIKVFKWYEFLLPFICLLGFTAIAVISVPKIGNVLIGESDFDPVMNDSDKQRWKTFAVICLAVLLLHALTYVLGVAVYGISRGFFSSAFWKTAWMKPNTDAQHYINIAENGYQVEGDDNLLLVFFPMLPFMIRAFNIVFANSYVSATVINAAATSLTAGFAYLTFLPLVGKKHAVYASFTVILLPGAIFMNSPMTEPLFMLFTILGLMFLQKRSYIAAGIFTALAGFTRSLGVLLAVSVAFVGIGHIVQLIKEKKSIGKTLITLVAGLLISILGTLGYLYINYRLHGDPFKFLEFQYGNWHQKASLFFDTPRYMLSSMLSRYASKPETAISLWGVGFAAIYGALLIIFVKAKKLPASYIVYFLCYFAVSIGCTWLLSAPRYLSAAFPLILAISLFAKKRISTIIMFTLVCSSYIIYMTMYMLRLGVY